MYSIRKLESSTIVGNSDLIITAHIQFPAVDDSQIHAEKAGKKRPAYGWRFSVY
jgi:hypothetical protein